MPAVRFRFICAALGAALFVPIPVWAGSPFAGLWQGAWSEASSGQHGRVVLGITAAGQVNGAVSNDNGHAVGPLSGTISDSGKAVLAYSYDQWKTRYAAPGVLRLAHGQLTGEVDFLAAGGKPIGHGVLMMQAVTAPAVVAQAAPAAATVQAAPSAAPAATATNGPIPTGQWKCYSAPSWMATAGGIGSGKFTAGQFGGYMWIYDAHHYANMSEKPGDKGTYDLVGDQLQPHDGPWLRVGAVLHYLPHGLYGKPTIHLGWKDTPGIGLACTQ